MTGADWLKAAVTILSAAAAAWVAARVAVHRWRTEMIGKRRAELAEEVLADFYRFKWEARSLPERMLRAMDDEAKDRAAQRFANSWADLNAHRFRFAAVFGVEATLPFAEIEALTHQVVVATDDPEFSDEEQPRFPQSFTQRLDTAVERVEATCRAAITAEENPGGWWKIK